MHHRCPHQCPVAPICLRPPSPSSSKTLPLTDSYGSHRLDKFDVLSRAALQSLIWMAALMFWMFKATRHRSSWWSCAVVWTPAFTQAFTATSLTYFHPQSCCVRDAFTFTLLIQVFTVCLRPALWLGRFEHKLSKVHFEWIYTCHVVKFQLQSNHKKWMPGGLNIAPDIWVASSYQYNASSTIWTS